MIAAGYELSGHSSATIQMVHGAELSMLFFYISLRNRAVAPCRFNIGMPQKILHGKDVSPIAQHGDGKSPPQRVRPAKMMVQPNR